LTSVDFGNSDIMNNRNRIYDEGFIGLIEGIIKSNESLISELYLQSACITGDGLCALSMMSHVDLQVLDLSHNDLGNEGAYYLKNVMGTLMNLNLASTKIGLKGISELSKAMGSEESPRLKHLDLT
jgi:Ran GTPase-activating protein (RanGAP) involved in mRNA processing and transport